ncbi:diguanylate cyclase [Thiomicrospira microaerophila]|nr:diguanylate cyclase [Thiomicrospira microaerophila]
MKPIDKLALQVCLSRYLLPQDNQYAITKKLGYPPIVNTHGLVPVKTPIAQKGRLLIVDDQPSNLKVLANGLKGEYLIQAADCGEKALQLAERIPQPDLILLDIVMPEMDGYAVIKALKNNPKTQAIPVVFVTALDGTSNEQKGLELGAVDYIAKPFKMPVVKARVRSQVLLKHKTDLLDRESHIDGLTGIANRRQFDEKLQIEGQRLMRNHQPLGVIMVDIDFFKPFNDNYGHGKGDECLVKVAQALQRVFRRPADLVARYGGEEFVAILPETNRRGVQMMAEKMRQAVWDLNFAHGYSAVDSRVTVSLGGISREVDTLEEVKELLKYADQALYQAKAQGRNQVVIYGI